MTDGEKISEIWDAAVNGMPLPGGLYLRQKETIMESTVDLLAGDYAIVELFGHTTLVGRIAEVESFGTKMLQIEALFNGKLLPPVLHGGHAIYRLTPCSRDIAFEKQPHHTWQLPIALRCILPPALIEDDTARTTGLNVRDDDDDLHG